MPHLLRQTQASPPAVSRRRPSPVRRWRRFRMARSPLKPTVRANGLAWKCVSPEARATSPAPAFCLSRFAMIATKPSASTQRSRRAHGRGAILPTMPRCVRTRRARSRCGSGTRRGLWTRRSTFRACAMPQRPPATASSTCPHAPAFSLRARCAKARPPLRLPSLAPPLRVRQSRRRFFPPRRSCRSWIATGSFSTPTGR